jgi:tetratricopeptide (TPR) repeat protein
MRKVMLSSAVVMLAAVAVLTTSCEKLKARDHLNQGVIAFKNAKYTDAVEHFKQSIALDPTYDVAQLYLATAYMSQWIPGAESPENLRMAQMATDGFLKVLEKNPGDTTALASLASICYQQASSLPPDQKAAKLDEAAKWNKKLIETDPKNKEAYYYLGVIAWAKWYPQWINARLNVHMKPEDPGPLKDKKAKAELSAQYSSVIDDGIANLNKALDIDKEYEDAMVYLSLLIREKADLLDNADDYKKQIEVADNWQQKALDTKKAKAARQPAANGITADK